MSTNIDEKDPGARQRVPVPAPANPPGAGQPPRPRSVIRWIVALLLCGTLAAGVVWYLKGRNPDAGKKTGTAGGGRPELPPIPVVVGTVTEKDVPIYLDGLGTVQAFQTVMIRARVDGQLRKVAFVEGQDVRTGDLLAEIDPDPYRTQVDQAAAKKAQDAAMLGNAQVDLQRYADMLAHEGVTRQVYDTQKALVNQLEATVKADDAALSSAQVQLAYTTITSPIDGRTGLRQVDQGNIVHANDTTGLVVVTQLKPISVVFTLPQQTLTKIQNHTGGDPFTVLAVDADNVTPLGEGKLAVIDNQIDTTTSTIRLKATFPNSDLRLWPGQFVNTRLLLTVRRKSPVVPGSVIQRGPEGAFAYVIKDDQTVDMRPVKVGQIEQGEALIDEGLRPGERVVVDGQYKLQRGSRIKPTEANAGTNAPGTGSGSGGARRMRPGGTNGGGRTKP